MWPRLAPKDEMGMLRPYLDEYKISATHLTAFLNVEKGGPQNFFERYMLKLPSAHNDKLAFGRAMHSALEYAQHSTNKGSFDIGSTITTFENYLKDEPMTKESFDR
jgi:ATP-dependent helicase/DNAse subunit B